MKLSEKIYYCRKKAGKSQETLAAELGVSRQSVSKWELGDAEPEISKLKLLAQSFNVSIDWLLSEDEPPEEEKKDENEGTGTAPSKENPFEAIPGVLGRLVKKYGWLLGIRIMLSGLAALAVGLFARYSVTRMFTGIGIFPGEDVIISDGLGVSFNGISSFAAHNPVYIMANFLIILGLVLITAGIVLAVVLRKMNKK